MNWQKVTKENLISAKQQGNFILACAMGTKLTSNGIPYVQYDILYCDKNRDNELRWFIYEDFIEAKDKDLEGYYQYFCLIDQPERSKREDHEKGARL